MPRPITLIVIDEISEETIAEATGFDGYVPAIKERFTIGSHVYRVMDVNWLWNEDHTQVVSVTLTARIMK
jgi:hypothetical protein